MRGRTITLFSEVRWCKMRHTVDEGLAVRDMSAKPTGSAAADDRARSQLPNRKDGRLARYRDEVCGYIRRRFGAGPPDPDDVVQTAFAKILANYDLDAMDNVRAFLYTAAHNSAIDMIRSQDRLNRYKVMCELGEEADVGADEITPERALLSQENFRIALDTINDMPEVERETLILYRIHELTLIEIAERVGKSKTSVIRYLASATRRLVDATRAFEHVQ